MSVGTHFDKSTWNDRAYQLWRTYTHFCQQAQELAGYLAPLSNQNVIDATGFTDGEVTDLKSGCNVADALRQLSQGSTDANVLTMARQVSALVGKFGGA